MHMGEYSPKMQSPTKTTAYLPYSPSAGGFLSDKVVLSKGTDLPSRYVAGWRYNPGVDGHKPEIIKGLTSVYEKSAAHGFSLYGASLRWLMYHSQLGKGDAIILGASKKEQIDDSVTEIAKGKLPADVVEEFEKFWKQIEDVAPQSYQELTF
jgi:aflatoxin B1 aldehyde reductase